MGRVYAKLPGPWIVRNKMRTMTLSTIDSMILAAVKPAWAGLRKTVEELRPKMEPKIRELTEPIFRAENEVIAQMRGWFLSFSFLSLLLSFFSSLLLSNLFSS